MSATNVMPLAGVIEPRWWPGAEVIPADSYMIDGSEYRFDDAPVDPDSSLAERMNKAFDEVGLVWVRNTGLRDLADMRRVARLVVDKEMRYQGGANPRGRIEKSVYEVGAPLTAWLHYHHEMAYIGNSTRMLGFLGHKAARGKGATFVSDNLKATDALLATELGEKLKNKGLCYHRNLTDREHFRDREPVGVYNHWQQSMLTEDPDEAARVAESRGLEVEWGENRLLKTRYYISAFEYFPTLDRNVLFSSVADDAMWFDTWPRVMQLPDDERPLKLTFGDGSEMTREEKQLFVDVYDRFGIPIDWDVGDVMVVCNYRFAHGRPGIHLDAGEERELGVIIGETFERVGDVDGKW